VDDKGDAPHRRQSPMDDTRAIGDECAATLGWALSVGTGWRRLPGAPTGGWGEWLARECFGERLPPSYDRRWPVLCEHALGFGAVLWAGDAEIVRCWATRRRPAFAAGVALALRAADQCPRGYAIARDLYYRMRDRWQGVRARPVTEPGTWTVGTWTGQPGAGR
jgi:hypothetical protein